MTLLSLILAVPAWSQISFEDPDFYAETVVTLPPSYSTVGLTFAPDGRIFVWQRSGVVRIVKDGALLPQPFIDIQSEVAQSDDGLLGLALDPNFSTNGYVYLLYTSDSNGDPGFNAGRLSRITVDPGNPDATLPASEVILLTGLSSGAQHAIGSLRFAPDGKLFVSMGDQASYNSVTADALASQDLNAVFGKILRVNPDGTAPADNPFYDGTNSVRSKVWAYGLRNPFRFSLHPVSGEPYMGDVGWNTWEEINRGRGANFGWPCFEGNNAQPEYQAAFQQCRNLSPNAVTRPLYTYNHGEGNSAIAGPFYNSTLFPQQYWGNLFVADYGTGWIRRIVLDANGNVSSVVPFAADIPGPVSLELGPDGALYYVAFYTGQVRRIRWGVANQPPVAVASATPSAGYSPLAVAFSSAGSFDPGNGVLTYLWDFGDGATSTAANPQHTYVAPGVVTFTARLTVRDVENASATSTVDVTVGGLPPVATIATPINGTVVTAGTTVVYQGSATDPEDGVLPASALSWTVLLHHNSHIHPLVSSVGPSGSFHVDDHGVGTFSYEVRLTATDSDGLVSTSSVSLPMPSIGLPDLVAGYAFSEGTGAITYDHSGNGNLGSISGAAWTLQGKYGNALSFGGVNDYVSVPDADPLDLGAEGTLEAWIKLDNLGAWHGVIAKGDANHDAAHNYAVEITDANDIRCILGNGSTSMQLNGTVSPVAGQFVHLACTWDGTTVRLYVNGVLNTFGPQLLAPAGNAAPLFIGQFGGNVDRLKGIIDEVRIYKRALTPAEVQSDMNTPFGGAPPADTSAPTAPAGLTATAAGTGQINLSWTASTDNVGVTEYRIERCEGVGCGGFAQIATSTAAAYNNTGLTPGTSYSYRVRAADAANNLSAYSIVATAVTASPETTPPTAPTGLTAAAAGANQINLNWTASTDNVGVTGYQIERCQGAGCSTFAQIATSATTAYSNTGLTQGTSYSYRVRATDAAGNLSPYSATASAVTASAPPPTGQRGAFAFGEGTGTTTADASGNGNTGTLVNGPLWTAAGKYGNGLTFDGVNDFVSIPDAASLDLVAAGTIEAWVRLDVLGQWQSVLAKGNTNSDPAHNYALDITDGNVIFCVIGNGSSSSQKVESAAAAVAGQFMHLACTWDGTTMRLFINGVQNSTAPQTTTPAANTSPLYVGQFGGDADRLRGTIDEVRIYNRALTATEIQADMAAPINATPDTSAPTAPSGLTATAVSASQINLSWTASTDDVGVTGYQIERCQDAGCSGFAAVGTSTSAAFSNTGLAAGTSYSYRVRATDAAGNLSSYSTPASAETASPDTSAPTAPAGLTATAVSASQINLSWTASTDNVGVMEYRIERCQGAGCSTFAQIGTSTAAAYNNTGLAPGTSYSYRVRAADAAANLSPYSTPASAVTASAPAPTGLQAAFAFGEGTGTTTADASGKGNTGTLVNGPVWTAAGKYGNGIVFDGANDHVSVPDSASLDVVAAGTIEAWVKLDVLGQWQAVIAKGSVNSDRSHNYALNITNGNAVFCVLGNGTASQQLYGVTPAVAGQFVHMACTWDGTTVRLYINGVQNSSAPQTITPAANTAPLFIGQFGGNADRLDGTIDEVRIYNRALTPGEIQTDMNTPIP